MEGKIIKVDSVFCAWVLSKVTPEEAKIWRLAAYPGALTHRVLYKIGRAHV